MIYTLTHHWNLARVMRLIIGVLFVFQGLDSNQSLAMLFGVIFILMALFTTGTCGSQCDIPAKNIDSTMDLNSPVDYEEVK